ncbi:MAG: response regulator [Selenomonadaceae bacterium]|nr:response regulator [Selenomonadaceae bacterium]
MKLVIVEDDLMVAAINREFALKTPELNIVATFYNGREALDFLAKNSIDLLLLDIYMSGYTGLELLKELRQRGNKTDAIIISAANDAEHIDEAFHLGIVDYLIKPFTYSRFRDAVQKFLLRRSLQQKGTYTQNDIDKLLEASSDSFCALKKGLQQQTLDKILESLIPEKKCGKFMTSEQISEKTNFSKMTIRRYMNYLIEQKKAVSRINYSTGGRPSIEYAIVTD